MYSWEEDPNNPLNKNRLSYGGYQPAAAPSISPASTGSALTAAAGPSSAIPAIGLGLGVAGTALNAYGAYKASEQAEDQFELQKEAYEFDKELSLQDRRQAEEERRRRAALEAGGYAGDYLQRSIQNYGGYNAMTGR